MKRANLETRFGLVYNGGMADYSAGQALTGGGAREMCEIVSKAYKGIR
jgi:hypothetical protein